MIFILENDFAKFLFPSPGLFYMCKRQVFFKKLVPQTFPKNISVISSFGKENYFAAITASKFLLGNTSSGIREGSYLGVPYVLIGNRQVNREIGKNVINVGYDTKQIIAAVKKQIIKKKYKKEYLYGKGNSSTKIAKLLINLPLTYKKILNYIK